MDQLNSFQEKFALMIEGAETAKQPKDILDFLRKAMIDLKKIQIKINIEKKKNPQLQFSIISSKIIQSLSLFREHKHIPYNINYTLAQFFNKVFIPQYFEFISNDKKECVQFINESLNVLDNVRAAQIYHLLIRKIHFYISFIYEKYPSLKTILLEIRQAFPIYRSKTFYAFQKNIIEKNLIELMESDNCSDKEMGIELLASFINNAFLPEQFELMHLCAPEVVPTLFNAASEEYDKAYIKFGNLLCTLLYPTKFRISFKSKTSLDNMDNPEMMGGEINSGDDEDNDNFNLETLTYVVNDRPIQNLKDLFFLKDAPYELSIQKEILELNSHIVEICLIFINTIIKRKTVFPLQFICYLICRRIYFSFPKYRKDIGDYIITSLSNLSKFQGQFEWKTSLESRQFAYYLLAHDSDLSSRIKSGTAIAPDDIRFENISIKKPSLTIGFNNVVEIDPRTASERLIEVFDENSIIYISMNMEEVNDINISFCKFDDNQNKWIPIFMRENVEFGEEHNKIILYAKEPCLYKIIFDNTNSWISKKKVLYRVVYLSPSAEEEE
ncbi:MAG: hypothetical protein MJ252_05880 [archaeon]|nr:hypothetical protein [archaeon]